MIAPEVTLSSCSAFHCLSSLLLVGSWDPRRPNRLCDHEAVPVVDNWVEHLLTESLSSLILRLLLLNSFRGVPWHTQSRARVIGCYTSCRLTWARSFGINLRSQVQSLVEESLCRSYIRCISLLSLLLSHFTLNSKLSVICQICLIIWQMPVFEPIWWALSNNHFRWAIKTKSLELELLLELGAFFI